MTSFFLSKPCHIDKLRLVKYADEFLTTLQSGLSKTSQKVVNKYPIMHCSTQNEALMEDKELNQSNYCISYPFNIYLNMIHLALFFQ